MPNIIYDEFKKFSEETWEKITSISPLTTYMKINEEGFTLDLVYKAHRVGRSFVILDSSIQDQEPETGADFFWNINCNGVERKLAIQAKRSMKPKSNYKGIKNKIDNITQIDRLMRYANRIDYEAYYFFYNGQFEGTRVNAGEYLHTDDAYREGYQNTDIDLKKLGCTVLAAEHVNEIDMDGPRFDRITKVLYTRSLQQFFKELCPPCSIDNPDDNLSGSDDNIFDRFKKFGDSEESLFTKVEDKFYVMSSGEYSVEDDAIHKAVEEFKKIKRNTKDLNEEFPGIKYGSPQAIVFTNY